MKLMQDTASLTNWLIETRPVNGAMPIPPIGSTLTELLWTDRSLLIVTEHTARGFVVQDVKTHMESWCDGTTYPDLDQNGNIATYGDRREIKATKTGYRVRTCDGWKPIALSLGDRTGYRDPSF